VLLNGPEQRLLTMELTQRLGTMLQPLTSRQRQVLILRGIAAAPRHYNTPGPAPVTPTAAARRPHPPRSGAAVRPLRRARLGGLIHEYVHVA
jgi:hypothetical protein